MKRTLAIVILGLSLCLAWSEASAAVAKLAVVAINGGNYSSPIIAMKYLSKWCGTPSETNQCLMEIMPGTYDIGNATLVMADYVSIKGSGREACTIQGTGQVVVQAANNAELRELTIKNLNGMIGPLYGIKVSNARFVMRDVDVFVSSTGSSAAVYVTGDTETKYRTRIQDCSLNAEANGINEGASGLEVAGNADALIRRGSIAGIDAKGSHINSGEGIRMSRIAIGGVSYAPSLAILDGVVSGDTFSVISTGDTEMLYTKLIGPLSGSFSKCFSNCDGDAKPVICP